MQPGDTIDPNQGPAQAKTQPPDAPLPEPQPDENPESPREPNEPDAPESSWQYQPEESTVPQDFGSSVPAVSWTASEYIDHEKRAGWFVSLSVGAVVVATLLYLITRDVVTSVVVLVVATLFGVTGARKPRTLDYKLDNTGIVVGGKIYPYVNFKSFSVVDEGAFNSVQLQPLKRFMPAINLYYPPEQEDSVLQTLDNYLPHEDHAHDPVDRLMRRIHF